MSTASIIKAAREQRNPQLLADIIPYAKALGMTFSRDVDSLVGRLDFQQLLIGDLGIGALHGGSVGALLEATAILSLLWDVEDEKLPQTINFSVEHLRIGRPKTVYASAIVTRHSPRLAKLRATAWHDDPSEPISTAYALLLLAP
jgi:acyl-coenzyme A thioesterase PaaI-like protein